MECPDAVKRPGTLSRQYLAALGLFGTLLLPLLVLSSSLAQISSTSGSAHSSAPPTGSVLPPTGSIVPPTSPAFVHNGNVTFNTGLSHSTNFPHSPIDSHDIGGHRHHHHAGDGNLYYPYYPYLYGVPVPYAANANDYDSEDDDSNYQGGPTIFDRRGSGPDSYIPPTYPGPAHARQDQQAADTQVETAASSEPATAPAPETPQTPTTLVFKDGRQVEVSNYAIVNQTLYDLTPGHARKIALADLDLAATEKKK